MSLIREEILISNFIPGSGLAPTAAGGTNWGYLLLLIAIIALVLWLVFRKPANN
jgi:hypothetical protein